MDDIEEVVKKKSAIPTENEFEKFLNLQKYIPIADAINTFSDRNVDAQYLAKLSLSLQTLIEKNLGKSSPKSNRQCTKLPATLFKVYKYNQHIRIYNLELISKAKAIAEKNDILVYEGVYIGLQGPTFETKAEYQWLHVIGGDTVGMSTVPEVIVAIHGGMKVFGMSVVTDLGIRDEMNVITHEEVLEAANIAAPKMALIFKELLGEI
jgi:hypothetical protein